MTRFATNPARPISARRPAAHSVKEPNNRSSPFASSQKTPGSPLDGSTDGVKRRISSASCATSPSISCFETIPARRSSASESPAA